MAQVLSGQTNATLCYDADFYPFGGERAYTNTCAQNYKFTAKERDSESGLDNFGARYYASTMGRFMTPDWAERPTTVPYAVFGDPQSLNLYTYVRNDPVTEADANGHLGFGSGNYQTNEFFCFGGGGTCLPSGDEEGGPAEAQDAATTAVLTTQGQNANQNSQTAAAQSTVTAATVGAVVGGVAGAIVGGIVGAAGGTLVEPGGGTIVGGGLGGTEGAKDGAAVGALIGATLGVIYSTAKDAATGPKAADAPGVTAGGQATDKYGNKLGPSGKPQVNETNSNTREAARNRALGQGSGAVEHSNPQAGRPHWHPTDAQGNKKPNSTHNNYPED